MTATKKQCFGGVSVLKWVFTYRHLKSGVYKSLQIFQNGAKRINTRSHTKEKPYMINSQVLQNWRDKKINGVSKICVFI